MPLIAVILALFIASTVVLICERYQEQAFQQYNYKLISQEVASEEVQFAHGIGKFLEMGSFPAGATITPSALVTAGVLPAGFPLVNPIGQSPIAYIGSNKMALITYTSIPMGTTIAGLGVNVQSSLSMSGFAAHLIIEASADSQEYSSSLVALEMQGNTASSPYAGRTVPVANYFSGYPDFSVPVFAMLVNFDSNFSGPEN